MLMADLRHDYVQTRIEPLDSADCDRLEKYYQDFEENANETLREEGVREKDRQFIRSLDIRYIGQGHPLTVPLPSGQRLAPSHLSEAGQRFDEQHLRTYLHNAPEEQKEIMGLRFTALGLLEKPKLPEIERGSESVDPDSKKELRDVYMDDRFEECVIYDRRRLRAGNVILGPAVVEEVTSTTLVLPEYSVTVDRYGHLIIGR
jgi:N-methylhydantoinase A